MRALVFTAPGRVELRDVAEPRPGDGEALVEVAAAGICGSDVHGVVSPGFRVPPLVLGHEFAGTVDGRRVVVNPIVSCGRCDSCGRGLTPLCRQRALLGVHRPGGLAERVAVPVANLHPIPDGLDWQAAAMIEPVANAVHACDLAGGPTGDLAGARVAVFGAGAVGLVTLLVARSAGAASVSVVDPDPDRAAVADRLGSDPADADAEFDVTVDAAGVAAARAASVARLRPGGLAVWLGLAEPAAGFDATELVRSGKRVLGSFAYTHAELARAAELVAGFDLSWVTGVPLARSPEVFADLMAHRGPIVKAVFHPAGGRTTGDLHGEAQ